MKKPVVIGLLIAAIVAIPLLTKLGKGDDAKEVTVEAVEDRIIRSSVLASGTLIHEEAVRLSSEVIGKVKAVLVEEGQAVEKGQLVLQIDEEAFQASVNQNQAAVKLESIAIERQQLNVANLQRQWKRQQQLFERGLIGEDAFEAKTNELQLAKVDLRSRREALAQAQARLEQAQEQLSKTQIESPLTGMVTALDIKEGETAIASTTNIAGSSLMTIANPSSILTEVHVDEADIANIRLGQSAEVFAIAFQDTPLAGQVISIASTARQVPGRQGLSFTIKIALDDPQQVSLRPGMSCRTEIFTSDTAPVPSVPIQAVLTDTSADEAQSYVLIRDGDTAKRINVTLGLADDTYQEIKSGLKAGVDVVAGPYKVLRHLKGGEAIAIIEVEDSEDADNDQADADD